MNTAFIEPEEPGGRVVNQARCVRCKSEQYCQAVPAFSRGEIACGSCGQLAPIFTDQGEYFAAVRERS